jgi:hypothetical protein
MTHPCIPAAAALLAADFLPEAETVLAAAPGPVAAEALALLRRAAATHASAYPLLRSNPPLAARLVAQAAALRAEALAQLRAAA